MPLSTHTLACRRRGEAIYRFPTAGANNWTVRMTPTGGTLTFAVYASADLSDAPLCTVTPPRPQRASATRAFLRTGPFAYGRVQRREPVSDLQSAAGCSSGVDKVFTIRSACRIITER